MKASETVRAASAILAGFEEYHRRFRAITQRARQRFERRDWAGIRADTVERLGLHPQAAAEVYAGLARELGPRASDRGLWSELKQAYARAILGRDDFELAQTFFNSLTRRAFPHEGLDPAIDFLPEEFPLPYAGWEMASARTYAVRRVDAGVVAKVLEDAGFAVPFTDLEGDARRVTERINAALRGALDGEDIDALDVLRPVFVRNKAAYVVGRARRGGNRMPLLVAILNPPGGLRVDAVVHTVDALSAVFSFARWYFHADVASPRQVIGFLHSVLPRKRMAELYLALGYRKHAKTEFYGDLMRVIARSAERFVAAPGKPGTVMTAFTLPSYEFVLKLIRDELPPAKFTTRRAILERYRQVLLHDRVGRLVDFQEFEHLVFPRDRFDPELLDELLRDAAETVSLQGDEVRIRHLYFGRRVVPLDVYLRSVPPDAARAAVVDWGQAIKDLVAANIFPGDMLIKNFGVTRHGRVVFYDYDELCPLTECTFRRLPPAPDELAEMGAEPWFSVGAGDVFPEELAAFLGLPLDLRQVFLAAHSDLFDIAFWQASQEQHRRGEVIDFFPYGNAFRLRPKARTEMDAARGRSV